MADMGCGKTHRRARRSGRSWAWFRSGVAALGLLATAGPALAVDAAAIATSGTAAGAPACSSCHGAGGEGQAAAGFPRLAGLPSGYILHQLDSFVDGARKSDVMTPVAQALSPDERKALAAFYAAMTVPGPTQASVAGDAKLIDAGNRLAGEGRWSDGVPACGQCHGPAGQGVGQAFPPLAGQSAAYLSAQLKAWKAGTRHNDPLKLMAGLVTHLSDDDIAAVSAYYASLEIPTQSKGVSP